VIALHRLNRFNFAGVDSDIVGTIYSTYLTRKEKQKWGQYYTRPVIVRYILDSVGYTDGAHIIGPNKRLLDPSCGSGTFLVEAAKRLVDAYRGEDGRVDDPVAVLERVRNSLFGFDLNPFACYLAEVNLLVQVLDLVKLAHEQGHRPRLEPFHIYNVDSLAKPTGAYRYALFNTLLAEENDVVDQIKSRAPGTPYSNGFAFIVANPPYGAELSDSYKENLRAEWPSVFFGQPDSYIFFFKLGIDLLAANGRLGYITPNTYLVGANTAALRGELIRAGRIEQIVDLPQGIWEDATVDCVLMFLAAEADEDERRAQEAQINLLGTRDTLDKLATRDWTETLTQQQSDWIDDERHEIVIRRDALLDQIEDACRVPTNGQGTRVLRLEDIADSSQGIIVYETAAEGRANLYVRPEREVPPSETEWRPLLDSTAFVGRYELRWGSAHPYLKYGEWLCRGREARFFDSPKIVLVRLRNKSLKRRLVGTYDESGFYNRDNFNNIIQRDENYNLKYVLALFNSSLLNYWYARKFDNVNINPDTFRQLPIYPASAEQQSGLVELVERLLENHRELNRLREQGYTIKQGNGAVTVEVPYDKLLRDIQEADSTYPTLTLFDARAAGMFSIPARCDLSVGVSSNVFTPTRHPETVVLRHNKLWFEVPDEGVRKFLRGYLGAQQWRGRTWDEFKSQAMVPADADALTAFFAEEERQRGQIETRLDEIARLDAWIDEQVLDLYGIVDLIGRRRVLGDAPAGDDDTGGEAAAESEAAGAAEAAV
jgi:type I restriction enzyme M protein